MSDPDPGAPTADGSRAPAPRRAAPALVANRYEVAELLGQGGMGAVHRAHDLHLRRDVALKRLLGDPDERAVARFLNEARALARLQHPGCVQIHDVGTDTQGAPYLAMELVTGQPLSEAIEKGELTPARAALLLHQVAGALQRAHEAGIVHRDVKPRNVLVTPAGAKLIDFGIAHDRTSDRLTVQGALVGTVGYLPPEQAGGERDQVDARSDVYALGATLYDALVGRPPYAGMRELVQRKPPVSPRKLAPSVSADLAAICLRCLALAPGDRYQTAADLQADLGRFLAGEPVLARRASSLERAGRWILRHRAPVAAVGVALAAITLAAGGAWVARTRDVARERDRALEAVQKAQERLARAHGERSARAVADGRYREAALFAAKALALDPRPEYRVALALARGGPWRGPRRTLVGHGSPVEGLAYDPAPGARRLASAGRDGTVRLWDAARGGPSRVLEGHAGAVRSVAWSPDGRRLASAGDDRATIVWDAGSGAALRRLESPDAVASVAWSPDGRTLATGGADARLALWDPDSGQRLSRDFEESRERIFAVAFGPGWVAAGTNDPHVWRWDVATGRAELLGGRRGHSATVTALAVSSDGLALASGSQDRNVVVWPLDGERAPIALRGHGSELTGLAFVPGRRRLVSAGQDGGLRLWDAETGQALWSERGGDRVAVSPDGRELAASWAATTRIELLDLAFEGLVDHPEGRAHPWHYVALAPDGRRFVAGSADQPTTLHEASGQTLATLWPEGDAVPSVAWSPDGSRVALGSYWGSIRVVEVATGEAASLRPRVGAARLVQDLAWSADGERLAAGAADGTVTVFAVHGARELATFAGSGRIWKVAFSPDGRTLASAGEDLILRDVATGREEAALRGARASSLAWSPDGSLLAWVSERSGTADERTVKVASRAGLRAVHALGPHADHVASVAWSPDGRLLASGSADGTARLWDVAGERLLATLPALGGSVRQVSFLRGSGPRLAVRNADEAVRIWPLEAILGNSSPAEVLKQVEAETGLAVPDEGGDPRPR